MKPKSSNASNSSKTMALPLHGQPESSNFRAQGNAVSFNQQTEDSSVGGQSNTSSSQRQEAESSNTSTSSTSSRRTRVNGNRGRGSTFRVHNNPYRPGSSFDGEFCNNDLSGVKNVDIANEKPYIPSDKAA